MRRLRWRHLMVQHRICTWICSFTIAKLRHLGPGARLPRYRCSLCVSTTSALNNTPRFHTKARKHTLWRRPSSLHPRACMSTPHAALTSLSNIRQSTHSAILWRPPNPIALPRARKCLNPQLRSTTRLCRRRSSTSTWCAPPNTSWRPTRAALNLQMPASLNRMHCVTSTTRISWPLTDRRAQEQRIGYPDPLPGSLLRL
jgi:hypothetical protein